MHVLQNCLAAFVCLLAVVTTPLVSPAQEQQGQQQDESGGRPVAYLKLDGQLTDTQSGRVQNVALQLQTQAEKRNQRALLVLGISPGTSSFHLVEGLARFLTSAEIAQVKTVAWIPEDVTGSNNVLLALACEEVVMHPDAEIGDIGRGVALAPDEREDVLRIVRRSKNPRLSEALARKMADPAEQFLRIKVRPNQNAQPQTEFVTNDQLRDRQNAGMLIEQTDTLIEGGSRGVLSGSDGREWGVLVTHTAGSLAEVADAYGVDRSDLRQSATAGDVRARLIKLEGVIDDVQAAFVKRQIERAAAEGANVLIMEIDSPGGFVHSAEVIINAVLDLDSEKIRTVAYVPDEAISAAAMTALAFDEIYMHPDALIGDAGLLEIQPGQPFERAPEKQVSIVLKKMEGLAKRKNRPPALLKAMVDRNLEVFEVTHRDTGRVWYMSEAEIHESGGEWIKGPMVPESKKGLLLTLNGVDAHELKLAEPPVEDFAELKQRLGIPADQSVRTMQETWVDKLVFHLNNPAWAATLLTVAMICLFIELHFMTGVMAAISALCFALFFWSKYMGGTAGWLEVILFTVGVVCLGIEIFILPGFGFFGIFGSVLTLLALVMASQTFGHAEPGRDFALLAKNIMTLSLSIAAVVVIAAVLNRFLPHMPMMGQMVLSPPGGEAALGGPQLRPDLTGGPSDLLGASGKAHSVLRPAGKAWLGDRLVDVVSDGPYIPAGTPVEVVQVNGNRIVVREVS